MEDDRTMMSCAVWLCDFIGGSTSGVWKGTIDRWAHGQAMNIEAVEHLLEVCAIKLEGETYELTSVGQRMAARHHPAFTKGSDDQRQGNS